MAIFSRLWERYLLREIIKVFFLFLGVFFFLYTVMDYSSHAKDFLARGSINFKEMILYYAFQFFKRSDLLLPIALLIATIKVLCSLNAQRELLALQVGGLSLKRLLRPFFIVAAACVLFNFANAEWVAPKALNYLDSFRASHFKYSKKGKQKVRVHMLHLKDQSKLFYQNYEADKKQFFDAIWVANNDEIWRIKYLSLAGKEPLGRYVDHMVRDKSGFFYKKDSYDQYIFDAIKWNKMIPSRGYIPYENWKTSSLFHMLTKKTGSSYDSAQIVTQLSFKCIMPFLSFLVVLGIAPFCVRYSRQVPVFFIYACALFGFIAFFMGMDAMVIIGENRVIPPLLAILLPFAAVGSLVSYKFLKAVK